MNLRKRYAVRRKFFSLLSMQAERLCCLPGSGGGWNALTGDGEAFRCVDRQWMWVRQIRAGKWAGPWVRQLALVLLMLSLSGCGVPAATWLIAGTVGGAVFEAAGVTETAATWYLNRKGKSVVPMPPTPGVPKP